MITNQKNTIGFTQEVFWEFTQNIVLLTGFFVALHFWQKSQYVIAIVYILISGMGGAWNIRFIENRFKGHHESTTVTLTNSVMLPSLMFIFVAYLSASWSNWKTDCWIGMIGGLCLSVAQRLTIKAHLDSTRSIAFAIAFPLTLLSIRGLMLTSTVIINIFVSTILITLLIVIIHRSSKKKSTPKENQNGI
ncbi:MAG: hypothetical protein JXA33_17150 [Anaerolineae bacterium]|nr:hypothetical protein [Anaerolineae bacterium]